MTEPARPIEAVPLRDPLFEGIAPEWVRWAQRWKDHSTLSLSTRLNHYHVLLMCGRWLARHHPDVVSPEQWTTELAATFVAFIKVDLKEGELAHDLTNISPQVVGKPVRPSSKAVYLATMRRFFCDCQEWGWIRTQFNPVRVFKTPRSLLSGIGRNPRIIDNDVWVKIVWAAMNLEEADVPNRNKHGAYPLALIRAIAATWVFSGLRSDEIRRLRVGCVRWQREAVTVPETGELLPKDAICLLEVPGNKTSTAFTKPVYPIVGRRIEEWEAVRPPCLPILDRKTGEHVNYLFVWKQHPISGHNYINVHLIPLLCRKAGVPERDSRGPITSQRARSTMTTQVYKANARVSLTKLAKAYVDADYLGRNVATVEVLIDQEAVLSGAAAAGETWKYYDLGHGFCTYSFYAQCEHRMACAKCPFYLPKDAARAQILEGKASLARMLELIPLTEDERAAVEDGQEACDRLLAKLADVPTPVGPTPRTLAAQDVPVLPPTTPRRTPAP